MPMSNSHIAISGKSGYGTYSIGTALNSFYGSDIKVPDYGAVITGGNVIFGASNPETVARLNTELKLGLTAAELASITTTQSSVKSDRFGVMVWNQNPTESNTLKIMDGTVFETGEAVIVDRGAAAVIDVDGSKGAQLKSGNGIILQMMDLDKAPSVVANGKSSTTGVYHELPVPAVKVKDFDVTLSHTSDVSANFNQIALKGDFYNGISASSVGAPNSTPPSGKNLVLKFDQSSITGVITASVARHSKDPLTSADYKLVSEVKNTPGAAVNNGVIVSLFRSTWTVTGTSYLTCLTIGDGSSVAAPKGSKLILTVDGVAKPVKAGAYQGAIVLTVEK